MDTISTIRIKSMFCCTIFSVLTDKAVLCITRKQKEEAARDEQLQDTYSRLVHVTMTEKPNTVPE